MALLYNHPVNLALASALRNGSNFFVMQGLLGLRFGANNGQVIPMARMNIRIGQRPHEALFTLADLDMGITAATLGHCPLGPSARLRQLLISQAAIERIHEWRRASKRLIKS